jgi:hypothetical protein
MVGQMSEDLIDFLVAGSIALVTGSAAWPMAIWAGVRVEAEAGGAQNGVDRLAAQARPVGRR